MIAIIASYNINVLSALFMALYSYRLCLCGQIQSDEISRTGRSGMLTYYDMVGLNKKDKSAMVTLQHF